MGKCLDQGAKPRIGGFVSLKLGVDLLDSILVLLRSVKTRCGRMTRLPRSWVRLRQRSKTQNCWVCGLEAWSRFIRLSVRGNEILVRRSVNNVSCRIG